MSDKVIKWFVVSAWCLAFGAVGANPQPSTLDSKSASGVKYRGIFINDEDWSLRPWAIRHFGKKEQIGTNAYREVFRLMKEDGLNLLWPAMHEGGYEFSERPENLALAKEWGIAIGTSHCEPMLRNNCYIPKEDRGLWSWTAHRDFVEDYWREGVRRGKDNEVLWTIGMRGIHDGGMKEGKTKEEKIAIMESVFAFQTNLLATLNPKPMTLFCPYKEVLPLYNAGLKVPDDAVIMWVNDNFGYVRRIGGNDTPQGIYWHLSYHGYPHGYLHLCTTPPAFMWYELVAKCWNNGVRDVWMVNAGDVFQAELLLYCYGKMAATPDVWGADSQEKLLAQFVGEKLGVKGEQLEARIVDHLTEYYTLGFIRKPEHMCIHWTQNLPQTVKSELLARYEAFLAEDLAIEKELAALPTANYQLPTYFRLIGFQAQFLAHAGIIHLTGKDKDYAYSVFKPLYARWDKLEDGKWSGFWCDTVDEHGGKRQKSTVNRWSTQMQWAWNEPDAKVQYHGTPRRKYPATAYRADVPEPTWLKPSENVPAKDGGWTQVKGLGTSGRAFALLPVKPGVAVGATLAYDLSTPQTLQTPQTLVLQFLPDYALWPGLKLGVNVQFDDGAPVYVAVPKSDANIGEKDVIRNQAVQDNFIRVPVPIPAGAKRVKVIATDPGVVIDKVGVAVAGEKKCPVVIRDLADWEFRQGEGAWRRMRVPHDWAIAGPFAKSNDLQVTAIRENGERRGSEKSGRSGGLPWIGSGEYRTVVAIPAGTMSAAVVFEGAMAEPEVFWDGKLVGGWKYGYTTFKVDLPIEEGQGDEKVNVRGEGEQWNVKLSSVQPSTSNLQPSTHELRVKVTTRPESHRWYPGAGLIRPVKLVLNAADAEAAVLARPEKRKTLPKIEMKEDGFYIGGKKVKFQGVCLHHDLGQLGAAWHPDAFRRQIRKLKEIGVNAIRTSHNPPLAEQLDICDEEGIWVMAESFDEWRNAKCANGYHIFYDDWWRRDLEQLVKVCRDHPCVVMYSIGNEISETRQSRGQPMATEMRDFIRGLDPTRPVTMGCNNTAKAMDMGVWQVLDLPGANYNLAAYEMGHRKSHAPGGLVLGSETASTVSSRGEYPLPWRLVEKGKNYHANGQCSDFDNEKCSWAVFPDDDFAMQDDQPWTVGQFVWTGFDYLGEPTPYDEYWPSRSSYFGIFDLAGLPKNRAWLYRSVWRKDVPTLHVFPHWNWEAQKAADPNFKVPIVTAYSSFDEAELFVNGKSMGRVRKDPKSRFDRYRLNWRDVPYESGEIKVVAYGADGHAAMEETVRTADAFDHYAQEAEIYGSLVYITVKAVDANGTLLPDAADKLHFTVTGAACFRGVCNGDPTSLEPFTEPTMRLFHGQLVVALERIGTGDYRMEVERK